MQNYLHEHDYVLWLILPDAPPRTLRTCRKEFYGIRFLSILNGLVTFIVFTGIETSAYSMSWINLLHLICARKWKNFLFFREIFLCLEALLTLQRKSDWSRMLHGWWVPQWIMAWFCLCRRHRTEPETVERKWVVSIPLKCNCTCRQLRVCKGAHPHGNEWLGAMWHTSLLKGCADYLRKHRSRLHQCDMCRFVQFVQQESLKLSQRR
jgi:hypothetical protein